jgi:hypothetical protein
LPPLGWQWHFLLLRFLYGLFNFSVVVSKETLEDITVYDGRLQNYKALNLLLYRMSRWHSFFHNLSERQTKKPRYESKIRGIIQ